MVDLIVVFKGKSLRVETGDGHPYTITFENGDWLQLEKVDHKPGVHVVDKSWKGKFLSTGEVQELSDTIKKAEDKYAQNI